MKWTEPEEWSQRIVTKFLLFPVKIGTQSRWLEKATISQQYRYRKGFLGEDSYNWENLEFIDEDKTIEGKELYSGFHKIKKLLVYIKGNQREYECIDIKPGVAGLVTDSNNRIALVRQVRPCIDSLTNEIPAGLLDKFGFAATEVLIEELKEECEIEQSQIDTIGLLHSYYPICGSSNTKTLLYRVKLNVAKEDRVINDDGEVESVKWLLFDEFEAIIRKGHIKDAKTLLAYYCWKEELGLCHN